MKKNSRGYKIILTVITIVIIVLSFSGNIDNLSRSYTQRAFDRALVTFGIARAINGIISVAQGTEVAIHPAGFGINLTPGQVLDPINDLIERFSWVMLASAASLGIQKVFIDISASLITSIILTSMVVIVLASLWKKNLVSINAEKFLSRFLLVLLFIRFAVPLTAIGSELMYNYFLAQEYQTSSQGLGQTKDSISSINSSLQEEINRDNTEKDIIDKAVDLLNSAKSNMDIGRKINEYKNAVADASQYTINLIVIFIIQTVLFPLLFLWVIYQILKTIKAKYLL